MTDLLRPIVLLATVALVLAACGGGTGGGGATAAPDGGAATAAAPTGQAPSTDAPAATEPPTGGGTAAGACELVTADELAEILGVASVTTTLFAGPPDTCSVDSSTGEGLVAWSYSITQAQVVYDVLALPGQSVDVPGIGDKAAFVDNTGLLVLKGSALMVIGVATGADDAEKQEFAKRIGAIAADRM